MANWPAVDPNDPGAAKPSELQNMATGFTYEPGSTFKAFTVAGALQQHLVTPSTPFYLPIELQVADRTITDAESRGAETLTVAQILAQSSNVGAVKIGLELGAQHFYDWVRKFGFASPTGVQFPGEEQGIVPDPSARCDKQSCPFSGSTMGNLPIGQGLSVTPIQMAAAYSAIADGGILRPPQLVLDQGDDPVSEPPGTRVISAQTAAEQVEHYWGSLLADVPFSRYASNPLVAQAVADMNGLSFLRSNNNNQFPSPVTPQNLFRGQFTPGDGNVVGPYISQFMVQPTFFGAQPISQQYQTFLPIGSGGSNYMTSVDEFQLVQNGGDSGRSLAFDPTPRFVRNGRDLAAYTHVDVLYQAYFTAFLVLAGIGAPPNPGNPYIGSQSEKAFGTHGGPDCAATLAEMATRSLKASWYHKWIKDLRMRPEEYGALVHARATNSSPAPQAAASIHRDVLNSDALRRTFAIYGTYLLPQAFPEGSPTHPCYPTGHGTVGGACITALKFFFDGSQRIRPLLTNSGREVAVASNNGLSLNAYTGSDRNRLDINGELNKLAFNVSFGHGIHAGIHFRSSTYWSILLGEQVALSVLQDHAGSYNEPFTVNITKFDGTTATISNE